MPESQNSIATLQGQLKNTVNIDGGDSLYVLLREACLAGLIDSSEAFKSNKAERPRGIKLRTKKVAKPTKKVPLTRPTIGLSIIMYFLNSKQAITATQDAQVKGASSR